MYDAIIFLYTEANKYSVHALLAALDVYEINLPTLLCKDLAQLYNAANRYENPLIVVSMNTIFFVEYFETLRKILSELPGTKVAGGPHPTGDPVGTLLLGFDYAFVGEGEHSLPEFVLGELPKGIVWRDGDSFYFTGRPKPVSLEEFPSFPWWRGIVSPIEITRGCCHGCKYCETPFIHGFPRHRPLHSVEHHIEAYVALGKRDVRFISPDSFDYPYFYELLQLPESYPVRLFIGSFPSEVRPEHVDEEKLKAMKEIVSNKRIVVGAQSGSERMLELMSRGHTVEDVIEASKLISSYGFVPEVDFIFGLPGETGEDISATLELMRTIVDLGGRIHAHAFIPLPGTPWEDKPAGSIPLVVRKYIERLTGRGKVFGVWRRQETLAKIIHTFYRDGKILGMRGWRLLRLAR